MKKIKICLDNQFKDVECEKLWTENGTILYNDYHHMYFTMDGVELPSVSSLTSLIKNYHPDFDEIDSIRGKYAHEAMTLIDLDKLDENELDETLIPYVEGYRNFLTSVEYLPLSNEEAVYHKELQYAGRLDKTGMLNDKPVIIDIKTTVSSLSPPKTTKLQLSAYKIAKHCSDFYDLYALVINQKGKFKLHKFDDDCYDIVYSLSKLYYWKKKEKI